MASHIETGAMAHPEHDSSKLLNHLGLVAGMYDELGIGELIDWLIIQDSDKRTVSKGQAIKGIVLNGLGFTHRALYLTPLFFRDKPVDRLIGTGIEADHLNDDVLGRTLDKIYHYGPERLYSQVSTIAIKRLDLSNHFALKSPKRIMALMIVMTLCLLVYAALEYRIRGALKAHDTTFPDQKDEATMAPSAAGFFSISAEFMC